MAYETKSFKQFRLDTLVEELPTDLPWGEEVYYMDSNGVMRLMVGDQIGQAQPVLTKEGVGLGAVDNTSDLSKPVSTAQSSAIATASRVRHCGGRWNTSSSTYSSFHSNIPGIGFGAGNVLPSWTRASTGVYTTTAPMPSGIDYSTQTLIVTQAISNTAFPNLRLILTSTTLPGGANIGLSVRTYDLSGVLADIDAFNFTLFIDKTTLP